MRRPWGMSFIRCGMSFIPCGLSFIPCRMSYIPWGMSFIPCRMSFIPWWMSFIPRWMSFIPCRMSFIPCRMSFIPRGLSFIPRGLSYIPWGMSFIPCGLSFIPCGLSFIPCGLSFIPCGLSFIPRGLSFIPCGLSFIPRGLSYIPWGMSFIRRGTPYRAIAPPPVGWHDRCASVDVTLPCPMRPLADLLDADDAGAAEVRRLLAHAVNPVEVIRGDRPRGERSLLRVQVPASTVLGAVAYRLGGLVFDHGWLRLLGSGAPRAPRDLAGWNGPPAAPRLAGATLVADDVTGGFFAVNGGAFAGAAGGVHYFAADDGEWEDLEIDYRGMLEWACNGDLDGFYAASRWPEWELEMIGLGMDQGLDFEPALSIEAEGRQRRRVAMEALWARVSG